jgi:hypothetical protein
MAGDWEAPQYGRNLSPVGVGHGGDGYDSPYQEEEEEEEEEEEGEADVTASTTRSVTPERSLFGEVSAHEEDRVVVPAPSPQVAGVWE